MIRGLGIHELALGSFDHNYFVFLRCTLVYNHFGLHSGPAVSEQPRPTEEMNGVLHEDELPPQVIKRCEKGHVSILQVVLYKMCTCCMLFLYSVEFVRIVEKWPVNFSFQLATFKNVEQDKASSPKIKCSFIKCNKKKIIVC